MGLDFKNLLIRKDPKWTKNMQVEGKKNEDINKKIQISIDSFIPTDPYIQ